MLDYEDRDGSFFGKYGINFVPSNLNAVLCGPVLAGPDVGTGHGLGDLVGDLFLPWLSNVVFGPCWVFPGTGLG